MVGHKGSETHLGKALANEMSESPMLTDGRARGANFWGSRFERVVKPIHLLISSLLLGTDRREHLNTLRQEVLGIHNLVAQLLLFVIHNVCRLSGCSR